jgi:ERCC4-type nuclease
MLVVDVSEHADVKKAFRERIGQDAFKIERLGVFDCRAELLPANGIGCLTYKEMGDYLKKNNFEISEPLDKEMCKLCRKRKYIRFADFTNESHSFYYERKTVYDFISSRRARLYEQLDKMDAFISGRKGLILEGMGEYTQLYDSYWKQYDKKLLSKLSPIQQVILLAGTRKIKKIVDGKETIEEIDTKEWTWSFVRELKMRDMEFVQTWNLDETIEFLLQCDEGYDKTPKIRLIPKRHKKIPLEREILGLFDGIGKVRSEKILKEQPKIKKIIEVLIKNVKGLGYETHNNKRIKKE